ncbi:MAG TPA: hypothetical protein VF107_03895 [Burkholderiaceae bacterium]
MFDDDDRQLSLQRRHQLAEPRRALDAEAGGRFVEEQKARPRLLFLDEPTAGLGIEGTARLGELVASLKRELTIVIIEHDMRFLFGLADRISVIHWGQVIAEGTPEMLRANPWVQRSSLGSLAA